MLGRDGQNLGILVWVVKFLKAEYTIVNSSLILSLLRRNTSFERKAIHVGRLV